MKDEQLSQSKEPELTPEARQAIRLYMLTLVTLPALLVSIATFFLGYFVKDIATASAFNQAYTAASGQILKMTQDATQANIQATAAKDQASAAATQVASAAKEADQTSQKLPALLTQQQANVAKISEQVTSDLLQKPEFLNTFVRTDKLYQIQSSFPTKKPLLLDIKQGNTDDGTVVQVYRPTPSADKNQDFNHAQVWKLAEFSKP